MSSLEPAAYEEVLERALRDVAVAADVPVVICGMAGAAQGWLEAPYVDLPANLDEIPRAAIRIPDSRRDIRILPGLAQRDPARPDVIRGEETLLLGAARSGIETATICLPGTHSKWVKVRDGAVHLFSTTMTGELFALLAQRSTLSHCLADVTAVRADNPAFAAAVRETLDRPDSVSRMLFSVRAGPLLGLAPSTAMAAKLSGHLIGLELAGMMAELNGQVTLVSSGNLAQLYRRAMALAGIQVHVCDADELVRAGLFAAARTLWPSAQAMRTGSLPD